MNPGYITLSAGQAKRPAKRAIEESLFEIVLTDKETLVVTLDGTPDSNSVICTRSICHGALEKSHQAVRFSSFLKFKEYLQADEYYGDHTRDFDRIIRAGATRFA